MHSIQCRLSALAVAVCLAACGCATKWKEYEVFHIPHTVSQSYARLAPKRVAILPFENVISEEDLHSQAIEIGEEVETRTPELIARETLYKHLSVLPFQDVELSKVDQAIGDAKTATERARAVAKVTGADTVVTGKLKRYHHSYWVLFSYSGVAAELEMINVESGRKIWSSDHSEWGLSFSLLFDFWNLVPCAYYEFIWRRELRRRFDDMFNDMVKTLPERQAQLRPKKAKNRTDKKGKSEE